VGVGGGEEGRGAGGPTRWRPAASGAAARSAASSSLFALSSFPAPAPLLPPSPTLDRVSQGTDLHPTRVQTETPRGSKHTNLSPLLPLPSALSAFRAGEENASPFLCSSGLFARDRRRQNAARVVCLATRCEPGASFARAARGGGAGGEEREERERLGFFSEEAQTLKRAVRAPRAPCAPPHDLVPPGRRSHRPSPAADSPRHARSERGSPDRRNQPGVLPLPFSPLFAHPTPLPLFRPRHHQTPSDDTQKPTTQNPLQQQQQIQRQQQPPWPS
jgi:hypothetical protein